jgi:hypothetical protein
MDSAEYCRQIETHLCRRNDGHLVRIVGPAFEQVCGWAERGVPLAVALRGIDRYCERYYAAGHRRRPVRIEFCEADILDAFDDWRRAVGISSTGGAAPDSIPESEAAQSRRKPSLAAHIDRAIERLLACGREAVRSPRFGERIDTVVKGLDTLAAEAKGARGEARSRIVDRLAALDCELLAVALDEVDGAGAETFRREAEAELAPFALRMTKESREQAAAAAFHRLVREAFGLPSLAYD